MKFALGKQSIRSSSNSIGEAKVSGVSDALSNKNMHNMHAVINKKVKQIQMLFDKQVKELKPILLEEACDFIKQKTKHVNKLLSK